ncbi:MAG: AAA family ATPase [Candidatus Methanoplasma sp.]|jgi:predicted ATPase|nr:AAA family ATPase [Candidatus Methanoplasma sp.]
MGCEDEIRGRCGPLERIIVKGFRSMRECDVPLRGMNVLVGGNGSGKSNLLSIFELLRHVLDRDLDAYVGEEGSRSLFFKGVESAGEICVELWFRNGGYGFELAPAAGGIALVDEWIDPGDPASASDEGRETFDRIRPGSGHSEPELGDGLESGSGARIASRVGRPLCRAYRFCGSGRDSPARRPSPIDDDTSLADDARNLAAFLYRLKQTEPKSYGNIVDAVRMSAPFFDDFILRPDPLNPDTVRLEWKAVGGDMPFSVHQLSDGTLRFICLATLLLQPKHLMPVTIVIDEPELGLHPAAILMLAEIMRGITDGDTDDPRQIIISTQSVDLLSEFDPSDVIVAERDGDASVFRRIGGGELERWLEDYSLGEIWKKNLIGGRS